MYGRGRKPGLQAEGGTMLVANTWQQTLPPCIAVSAPGSRPLAIPELMQYLFQFLNRFHHEGSMKPMMAGETGNLLEEDSFCRANYYELLSTIEQLLESRKLRTQEASLSRATRDMPKVRHLCTTLWTRPDLEF